MFEKWRWFQSDQLHDRGSQILWQSLFSAKHHPIDSGIMKIDCVK